MLFTGNIFEVYLSQSIPSSDQVVSRRLERAAIARRHHHSHRPHRAHLRQPGPRRSTVPRLGPVHRRPTRTEQRRGTQRVSRADDAAPQTNPRPRPPRPHQRRTPPTHRTHRRRRTPTPSLAGDQLPTATLLMGRISLSRSRLHGRSSKLVNSCVLPVRGLAACQSNSGSRLLATQPSPSK